MAEILVKIGDSGGSRDGEVIAIKPDGWLIPGAAMATWLRTGVEPLTLAAMPDYLQRRIRRRILRLRWLLTHAVPEIQAEYEEYNLESEALRQKTMAEADQERMESLGLDTNWGYDDLRIHAAVRVEDMTGHEAAELLDSADEVDHHGEWRAKRRWRLRYEATVDAKALADFRDPAKLVPVDRRAALATSGLFEASR